MSHNNAHSLESPDPDTASMPELSLWLQLTTQVRTFPEKHPKIMGGLGLLMFLVLGLAIGFLGVPILAAGGRRAEAEDKSKTTALMPASTLLFASSAASSVPVLEAPRARVTKSSKQLSKAKHSVVERNTPLPAVPDAFAQLLNNRTDSPCEVYELPAGQPLPPPFISITFPLLNLTCAAFTTTNSTSLRYNWGGLPSSTNTNALYADTLCDFSDANLQYFTSFGSYFADGIQIVNTPMGSAQFRNVVMPRSRIEPYNTFSSRSGLTEDVWLMNVLLTNSTLWGNFGDMELVEADVTSTDFSGCVFRSANFNTVVANGASFDSTAWTVERSEDGDDDDQSYFDISEAVGSSWAGASISGAYGSINVVGANFQYPYPSTQTTFTLADVSFYLYMSGVNASYWEVTGSRFATLDVRGSTLADVDFRDNTVVTLQAGNTRFSGNIIDNTFHVRCRDGAQQDEVSAQGSLTTQCSKVPPSCISAPKGFFENNIFNPELCPGKHHDGMKLNGFGIFVVVVSSVGFPGLLCCLGLLIHHRHRMRASAIEYATVNAGLLHGSGHSNIQTETAIQTETTALVDPGQSESPSIFSCCR